MNKIEKKTYLYEAQDAKRAIHNLWINIHNFK